MFTLLLFEVGLFSLISFFFANLGQEFIHCHNVFLHLGQYSLGVVNERILINIVFLFNASYNSAAHNKFIQRTGNKFAVGRNLRAAAGC